MAAPKREKLIETAQRLFAQEGFKGVSVDRLLEEAGVAKMTLYKAFPTKEALTLETLRRRDIALRAHISSRLENAKSGLPGLIAAYFAALEEWTNQPGYNGCYFVSALSEFTEREPIAKHAREHKKKMRLELEAFCSAAGAKDAPRLAADLRLLAEGAGALKHCSGEKTAFSRARKIALAMAKAQAT